MSEQILDLNELQELKEQFKLMDAKLEKQRILNEMMLEKSMKENLSHIERWYQYRLRVCTFSAPVVSLIFFLKYYDQGIAYWGFCLMIMAVALLELYLDRRSYNALNISNLPNLSMTQATENVIRHKKYRSMSNWILLIPGTALVAWTILLASDFTWNLHIIAITTFTLGISILFGLWQSKKNAKRLDEVLEQIESMKG
ncbi:MAG: hypothetical protein J6S05_06640 [Bacteroidaceae bacterium]|nr:hypothetical protein [Bacteroidaceae bacterium]